MGMILANAFAALERRGGAVLHVARARPVAHRAEHRFGERLRRVHARIFVALQAPARERPQLIVGCVRGVGAR